ncbi:recombinase RecA [Chitinophaga polysaccharea]|uniref:recombinase RecA n=1 Tax=Chitinophaga polysaccharea TaxID=1293035 RepID=UPI001454F1BE|nr:recombinase RecA [Chitinophaga polysaccharea]NLR61087.1 recombinase RecA [Chitinophaga polysaccharea]
MASIERNPALQDAIDRINKLYGKGTVITGSEKWGVVPVISTGSLLIDRATGIGGLPLGRVVELLSPESAGKTTLSLQTVASAQKMGLEAAYIDMEHAMDIGYARELGVDTDKMILSQPDYGEQALNIVKTLTESGRCSVIIVDSVSALVPKKELDGEVGDSNIGRQAWMMSQALRMLVPIAEKTGTLIVFINQIRMKVGVLFGSPEVGSGGEALKFYSSLRIDLRRQQVDKDGGGNKVKVRVIKNKLAAPFGEAVVYLEWGKGICRIREVINIAVDSGIISKSGSWYSYKSNKLGQGEEAVRVLLKDNEELYIEIEKQVLIQLQKTQMNET